VNEKHLCRVCVDGSDSKLKCILGFQVLIKTVIPHAILSHTLWDTSEGTGYNKPTLMTKFSVFK
jgi:hypothetical protein